MPRSISTLPNTLFANQIGNDTAVKFGVDKTDVPGSYQLQLSEIKKTVLPVFNVLQYGADPTGVADSRTAIRNAILAAYAAGGGIVYLPTGTYEVASQIPMEPGVHVIGAGKEATLVRKSAAMALTNSSIFVIKTSQDGLTHHDDMTNLSISNMTIDFNAAAWVEYTGCILISSLHTGGTDKLENIHLHDIEFINSQGATPGALPGDMWCIVYSGCYGATSSGLHVYRCKSPQWHQLLAGGGRGWDGIWVYHNECYHPRDNGITVSTVYVPGVDGPAGSRAYFTNINIFENKIISPADNGIWVGTDASQRSAGARYENVSIHDNEIIFDSWTENTSQYGIAVAFAEAGTHNLSINNNVIRRLDTNPATTIRAVYVYGCTARPTLTLSASFIQPAPDAAVTVTFSGTDPDLRVGMKVTAGGGTGTSQGGIYEVTVVNGSGSYDLTRRTWPNSASTSAVIPVDAVMNVRPFGSNVQIVGNACDGQLRCLEIDSAIIAANKFVKGPATEAANFEHCVGMDVDGNEFGGYVRPTNTFIGQIINNRLTDAHNSGGQIQCKANPESSGRQVGQELVLDGNYHSTAMTSAVHRLYKFTTSGSGTHRVRGCLADQGAPNTDLIPGDIGTLFLRLDGGVGTTLHINENGTTTGWAAK